MRPQVCLSIPTPHTLTGAGASARMVRAAGKRGRWYTLDEAREIRRKAGMKVDF